MSRELKTCAAQTRHREPCGMPALVGRDLCWNHDPLTAQARAEARRRGGRNRRAPLAAALAPLAEDGTPSSAPSLRSVDDVLREAELALADAKLLENSARRAAAIVSILTLALRGLEVGELEGRLEVLEQRIGGGDAESSHAA